MNLQQPLAAFFDLDGTLATRNQPPASADVEAIRHFRRRGNFAFLCTGRSPGFLYDAVTDIGFDGAVTGAGAHIVVNGTVLYRTFVTPSVLAPILEAFEGRSASTLIMETESGMIQLAAPDATIFIPQYPRIETAAQWHERYAEEVVTKLTVYGTLPASITPYIEQHLSLITHPTYYEIVPKGCSKSDGIRRVLEHLHLSREQTLAFGDSANDHDMLTFAGIGVAMGNADDRTKALADYVTLPLTECGVAHALQHLTK